MGNSESTHKKIHSFTLYYWGEGWAEKSRFHHRVTVGSSGETLILRHPYQAAAYQSQGYIHSLILDFLS